MKKERSGTHRTVRVVLSALDPSETDLTRSLWRRKAPELGGRCRRQTFERPRWW